MTSTIALLAVFANVLVLLGLAAAVVSPRASKLARLLRASLVFAFAWLTNAAVDATRPSSWTVVMGGAVLVVSVVAVLATLQLWAQAGDSGESPSEHRGDQGGGGPRRRWPDAPHHGGGGNDPAWWPEFERQLARYLAERESVASGRS